MTAVAAAEPQVLSSIPGRLRFHLPDWTGTAQRHVERELRQLPGVRRAQANPYTRNVLIEFDPDAVSGPSLLARAKLLDLPPEGPAAPEPPSPPPAIAEGRGRRRRARIAVRGLDRDPRLARRVVEHLERIPGVRAHASPLTGRVLVEYDQRLSALEDLVAEVADVELPELPDEDRPTHPLDPGPLIQSATRVAGAATGLAVLTIRRVLGIHPDPRTITRFATISGYLGVVQSFPGIRNGARKLMGRDAADLVFNLANVLPLIFSESPLGLILTGAEALVLLTEVTARRGAWKQYEQRLASLPEATPGEHLRLEAGDRVPRKARVVEGTGVAVNREGLPVPLAPGADVSAGARVYGGPVVVELEADRAFAVEPHRGPSAPPAYRQYLRVVGPASLAYAALTAGLTRSLGRTLNALLLVNPRPAIIGMETSELDAETRVLRGGVTIVGTRPTRHVRLPDVLLLDGPRILTSGFELAGVIPTDPATSPDELASLAAAVSAAVGSPWGSAFPRRAPVAADQGAYDGWQASARIAGARYTLSPLKPGEAVQKSETFLARGDYLLVLRRETAPQPIGWFALRPRLARGARELAECCHNVHVRLLMLPGRHKRSAAVIARRAGVELLEHDDAVSAIHDLQRLGQVVAFVSDNARGGPGFAACDLAIGLSSGQTGQFPARADLLAPDLPAVCAILTAATRREGVVRDSVVFSALSNIAGAVWGLRSRPGIERASLAVYLAALASIGDGLVRLRGGKRPGAELALLVDPRPERWGRRSIPAVLRSLETSHRGLSDEEARRRSLRAPQAVRRHELLAAMAEQLRSPIALVLTAGAGLSLLANQALDAAIIVATLGINLAVSAWQEREVGRAAEALRRMSRSTARVLRDAQVRTISAADLVPGDVLLLGAGDRVPADARLLEAAGLEVDEAPLTGESLPVHKGPDDPFDASRVVLEGSDVLVGTARAVVVAVGPQTRLGATAAALSFAGPPPNPLGERLGLVLRLALPLAVGGGLLAMGSGLLRRQPLAAQLSLGLVTVLCVIPEGLPLLAGTGQAGVARRLARRQAVVRRLAIVEALGRVDVACADKTGTLTLGRLAVTLVADADHEGTLPGELESSLRHVLLTAALASPDPRSVSAGAHPTDLAVLRAAEASGLDDALHASRDREIPFDPTRPYHAAVVAGRLCVKGAPELLVRECVVERRKEGDRPLDDAGRDALAVRARELAARGLRVLLVAQASGDVPPDRLRDLTCLGFVGISDPLRPGVRGAVLRCREAGVRVVMVTGDHPATAHTIARQAGVLEDGQEAVLTAVEFGEMENGQLDRMLEHARVIARATPMDKLRIVESFRRRGHVVAMTGDGVNDAPALRLADVGVAMGATGTEVARQAADLVLADDRFETLVEALIEGRGFWRNMRRGIGLLLGGNLGELGLIVGTNLFGFGSPLTARQILVVNLITDALPALAVVLQKPEHRNLAALAREGVTALDVSLRRDVFRRGASTGIPSLATYLLLRPTAGIAQASTAAFATIVATQLAQTLDAGRVEGALSPSVLAAVGGSTAILGAALTFPPLRRLLGLALPTPVGWAMIGGSAAAAVLLSRLTS